MNKQFWIYITILATLCFIMMYLFLPPNVIFYGADSDFHIQRLNALMTAFKNGTYPIYIDYEAFLGYGYATKWFYSDLLFIPFAWIGNLTNLAFAYKVLIFTITFLSGITTYITVKNIFKNDFAASISGLLYTFCTYHLFDLFDRCAVSESFTFIFIPLILWGFYLIVKGDYKKWYVLTISFSLLIFAHQITTALMLGTLILLLAVSYRSLIKEPRRLYYLLFAGFITIFLTAYFTMPIIEQVLDNRFFFQDRRLTWIEDAGLPLQLMGLGLLDGISTNFPFVRPTYMPMPTIGILLTLAICLRLFVKEKSENMKMVDIGMIIGLIYIISSLAIFPWGMAPFNKLNFIQFPWRTFPILCFFFAVGGGYCMALLLKKQKGQYISISIVAICTIFVMYNTSNSYKAANQPAENPYHRKANIYLGNGEYLPVKVPSSVYPNDREDRVDTHNETTIISNLSKHKGITELDVTIHKSDIIELPLTYYKGYEAMLNGKEIKIKESSLGLIELPINESGHIKIHYTGTITQLVSFYITIISFIILFIYIYYFNKRRRKCTNTF